MEKEEKYLAIGFRDQWVIYAPRWLAISLAGFLFWSAIIAAARQLWALLA